jgi:hypothetical protein
VLHHGPFHPGVGGFGAPGNFFWAFLIARLVLFVLLFVIPWIIGLTYVRRDANRRGQPGWLWALVTFPFGWLAVLAYLLVRAVGPRHDTTLTAPPAQPTLT